MGGHISIIIPNYNGERFLGPCLDSLASQTRPPDKVIVVDNGSRDRSLEIARGHRLAPDVIELERNFGFAFAANQGIEAVDSEMVALLNNDAVADPRWIESGLHAAKTYPEVDFFASLMLQLNDRDRVDSAGDMYICDGRPVSRGRGEPASGYNRPALVMSACAGAAFFRRVVFEELGGFEESFFAYLEDIDLGLRARARGHLCLYVPEAVVYHLGAGTRLDDRRGKKPVDSADRVYWIACNRLRVIARNWPLAYVIQWLPGLVFGLARSAAYHICVSGQGMAFFKGLAAGARLIPKDRLFFRKQKSMRPFGSGDSEKSGGWSFNDTALMIREGTSPWEP